MRSILLKEPSHGVKREPTIEIPQCLLYRSNRCNIKCFEFEYGCAARDAYEARLHDPSFNGAWAEDFIYFPRCIRLVNNQCNMYCTPYQCDERDRCNSLVKWWLKRIIDAKLKAENLEVFVRQGPNCDYRQACGKSCYRGACYQRRNRRILACWREQALAAKPVYLGTTINLFSYKVRKEDRVMMGNKYRQPTFYYLAQRKSHSPSYSPQYSLISSLRSSPTTSPQASVPPSRRTSVYVSNTSSAPSVYSTGSYISTSSSSTYRTKISFIEENEAAILERKLHRRKLSNQLEKTAEARMREKMQNSKWEQKEIRRKEKAEARLLNETTDRHGWKSMRISVGREAKKNVQRIKKILALLEKTQVVLRQKKPIVYDFDLIQSTEY